MHITYDAQVDVLFISFRDEPARDTLDIEDDVMAALDNDGRLIGLEILDARKRLGDVVFADSVPVEQLVREAITVGGEHARDAQPTHVKLPG